MRFDRRGFLGLTGLPVLLVAALGLTPMQSHALSDSEASDYVRTTIDEVLALVESAGDSVSKATRLRSIMEQRAAMDQIARFAAGTAWKDMNPDQQARFTGAFGKYLSVIYAARFQEYAGAPGSADPYEMAGVIDAGRKGLVVKTLIRRPGEAPVNVDWLVTDRPGRVVIADIVIEGVSMLVTQREEIGGMLEARSGDLEKLIADLDS